MASAILLPRIGKMNNESEFMEDGIDIFIKHPKFKKAYLKLFPDHRDLVKEDIKYRKKINKLLNAIQD